MKVAYFVSPSQQFAGIERVTHEIATGLATQHGDELDVHVVFSTRYEEALLASTAYTRHTLDVDRLLHLGPALRRLVTEQRFDVLVCPQVEASVVAWFATRGLGLPVLVPHLHGNPRIERAQGTVRTRLAFRLFESVVTRHVPTVLAVSPSLRDYAARTIARRCDVVFAPNPVRELGSRGRRESPDGTFRFVCVARLSHQKGQDTLVRALAEARAELPPFVLTLVGQGDQEAAVRQLVEDLGLADVVRFAGYSADPVEHLDAADCFVLASRWEGFGVALVEALQCGLPVVSTDCEFGPADVVDDPALGILVAPDDPSALARGMVAAARRHSTGADVEQRRARAREYRPEASIADHVSVLRTLADRHGLGRRDLEQAGR